MPVGSAFADVARLECPYATLQRLGGEAEAERARKHVREQREDGGAPRHVRHDLSSSPPKEPSGGSTVTQRSNMSTFGTTAFVKGSRTVGPPPAGAISSRSPEP